MFTRRRPNTRAGWIPLKRENRAFVSGTRVVRDKVPLHFFCPRVDASAHAQAIFATDVFPKGRRHYAPGTPLRLGVAAPFGPWTVSCDLADAVDASGNHRLEAPPLDVWDVARGEFEYCLPLLEVDEAAARDASAPLLPGWLGLRTALAPHMPPVRDMEGELRAALPLVVCGCGGDAPESRAAPPAGAAPADAGVARNVHAGDCTGVAEPTFELRRWPAAALAATRCVRVRTTYTRPPRERDGAGDTQPGPH